MIEIYMAVHVLSVSSYIHICYSVAMLLLVIDINTLVL